MKTIFDWISEHNISAEPDEQFGKIVFNIESVGRFMLLEKQVDEKIFDEFFNLVVDEEEFEYAKGNDIQFFVYYFGEQYYYTSIDSIEQPKLTPFRHVGKMVQDNEGTFTHLGVHGGYDLLNGTRQYKDWVRKAKFIGCKSLGICENNTLAGTLPFQIACKDGGIKSILGETITLKLDSGDFKVKVYASNKMGWRNMLHINYAINVTNAGFIKLEELLLFGEGVVLVVSTSFPLSKKVVTDFKKVFTSVFYQIDSVEWSGDRRDKEHLLSIDLFLKEFQAILEPVLVNDSYYLDKDESHIKKLLNTVGGIKENDSTDQYFKNMETSYHCLRPLFSDGFLFEKFFRRCIDNANSISDACSFNIDTSSRHLPKFEMNMLPLKYQKYEDTEDLFWAIMEEAIGNKLDDVEDIDVYYERLQEEVRVIKLGNLIDYFLILWDIIRWSKENGILVGYGRGSAGGSLVSYLMEITNMDPIKYDLLFERFLNDSRVTTSLPDIDVDFAGERREDVKRYMEEKYGINNVASIGTYSTMKLKLAFKDLGRVAGLPFDKMNFVNSMLTESMDADGKTWDDLFKTATQNKNLKEFIIDNVKLVNDIGICIGQPRSSSIHASAVIIVPKEDEDGNPMTIVDWLPVKKIGDALVSEWEHVYVEKAGFLKEDILGLLQLDKFAMLIKLIKENHNEDIDIYSIPLDDEDVYKLFRKGFNEDIFQFGTDSQKAYSILVKPENIEHLIAMNALYRPGPMDVNAHNLYAKIKNGQMDAEYNWGTEEILESTYGLIIYQEQTMQIPQVLADFTLTESDGLRRALTKKGKGHEAENFRLRFVETCVTKGCGIDEAKEIWNKLEAFTAYGFNRSHACAYAIMGYIYQWFKYHYPLEFWTTSLHYSKEEDVYKRINEMTKLNQGVKIVPPDINKSLFEFVAEESTGNIYWSLNKIKFVGDVAINVVMTEREKGPFYSLEDFLARVPKNKVNKRVMTSLIVSGCFDDICYVVNPRDRVDVLKKYYSIMKTDKDEELVAPDFNKNYLWVLKQKEMCGLGYIEYSKIITASGEIKNKKYIDETEFFFEDSDMVECTVGGVVVSITDKKTRDDKKFCELKIEMNNSMIMITVWPDSYDEYVEAIKKSKGKIILITGQVKYSDYKHTNMLRTTSDTIIQLL